MTKYFTHLFTFIVFTQGLFAQGVGFPDAPSQAPIGGLELLMGAGAALAWKKLKKK